MDRSALPASGTTFVNASGTTFVNASAKLKTAPVAFRRHANNQASAWRTVAWRSAAAAATSELSAQVLD
jgi:hypothetical protein